MQAATAATGFSGGVQAAIDNSNSSQAVNNVARSMPAAAYISGSMHVATDNSDGTQAATGTSVVAGRQLLKKWQDSGN